MAGKGANGDAPVTARETSTTDSGAGASAGALQLLICVAGIYGSL